jgi:hypothetical protein
MAWDVDFHDEFVPEFKAFEASVQDGLLAVAKLLADYGPQLGGRMPIRSKGQSTPT